jgi:hypothetical protein
MHIPRSWTYRYVSLDRPVEMGYEIRGDHRIAVWVAELGAVAPQGPPALFPFGG